MKWIDKPKISFEEIEVIREDKFVGWVAGQHKWLPATVGFESHTEFMEFIVNTPMEILGFEFDCIKITEAISTPNQRSATFTFTHARLLG